MGPYNHSWSVCLMFSEMFLKSKKKYTEVYTISKEKSTKQGRRKVWKSRGRLLFRKYWCICHFLQQTLLKVGFSQKGLMRLSFLQTGKPNHFPELKFWILFPSKWLKSCQKRTLSSSEWSKKAFFDLEGKRNSKF